jgi:hypothetical protein
MSRLHTTRNILRRNCFCSQPRPRTAAGLLLPGHALA